MNIVKYRISETADIFNPFVQGGEKGRKRRRKRRRGEGKEGKGGGFP